MKLFAQPINPDAKGFYFESMEEYEEGKKNCLSPFDGPVEEFEIQFVDGTPEEADLAKAIKLNQNNLEKFMELQDLSEKDQVKIYFLIFMCGRDLEGATADYQDVYLEEGGLLDTATSYFNENLLSEIPDFAKNYIDYKAFANDVSINGNMIEFDFGGTTYTCTNASDF